MRVTFQSLPTSDSRQEVVEDEKESEFNPARIQPRLYVSDPLAREAICAEIDGLLRKIVRA